MNRSTGKCGICEFGWEYLMIGLSVGDILFPLFLPLVGLLGVSESEL